MAQMKVKDETMRDQARQKLKDFSLMYKYMSGDSYLFILTLREAEFNTKELEGWIKESKLPVTKEDKDIWECVAKYDDGNVNIATLPSKKEEKRIRVSRSDITTSLLLSRLQKDATKDGVQSLGASYTHMDSLKGIVGAQTTRIVMYHAMLDSLEGLDKTTALDIAYLGFNRIRKFRAEDAKIPQINVLDLAGNPLQSLVNCPPCKELIVSSCWLEDLKGCPETVEILRCGHSLTLKSLSGLPKSVRILECSCTPHLNIDDSMNTFLTLHQIKVIREASYVVQK